MITNEIGVKYLFKEIFNINNDEDLILSSDFETENLKFIKVKDSAYKKIIDYLKNNNSFSFDIFLAINTTLAYGHYPKELDLEIEKYIIKYIDNFISELDYIKDFSKYLNKEFVQDFESIFVNKISYDLIKNIVTLSFRSRLYKDEYIYGIKYLLSNLSKYSHKEFSKWFLKTNRKDLKVIYAYATLNFSRGIDNLIEKNINSEILFVRAFSKIIFYNIDRNLNLLNEKKYFHNLKINVENLYFVLYYFLNKSFDQKNINSVNEFNNEIKKASEYLNYLNEDILKEFLGYVNNILVVYGIIDEIKNNDLQAKLFQVLYDNLRTEIKTEEFINKFTIENANVLGKVLLFLDEEKLNDFFEEFDKLIEKMQEPYYMYLFHNQWRVQISILSHYLIAIYIYFKEKGNNKYLQYKEKFLNIKKDFIHTNEKCINDILKQII